MAYRNHPRTRWLPTVFGQSWSRSAPAGGALTATARPPQARRCGRRALPYAAPVPRRAAPAGCRPTISPVNGLSFCGGPSGLPALRASRRASGVTAAERQRQRLARAQAAARAARSGPP